MSEARRVLVSGADGFVGTHVCRRLRAAGLEVIAATRRGTLVAGAARCVAVGAIDAHTDWSSALVDVETVVHLAAVTRTPSGAWACYQATNIDGTRSLAAASVQAGVQRFVYMSSIKVNGERSPLFDGRPRRLTADDPPRPEDDYGRSKLIAEQALQDIAQRHAMDLTVLRPPLIYGPGHKGNLLRLMRAIAAGWPLPLAAIANQRSLVYVENLADAVALALAPASAHPGIYTLADVDISTPELIQAIGRALGVKARLIPCPPAGLRAAARLIGRGDAIERLTGSLLVDSRHIAQALGWVPRVGWDAAMHETVAWFRERGE